RHHFYVAPHQHSLTLFSYNPTATTTTYTLSLHDALPIYWLGHCRVTPTIDEDITARHASRLVLARAAIIVLAAGLRQLGASAPEDRKSTRLNSSHVSISYAVFCLKKKNTTD